MQKTIILTITNKCNLDCIYCYEGFKNEKKMSLDTAKDILIKEFKENEEEKLEIDFHGGEPLCNFTLIRDLCEWTFSKEWECKYRFFITTNGTLLTDEMKEWFVKNKNKVTLGLSLDGDREMQNINRSNSFDKIDLNFFLENWPQQQVKMTISEQTIHSVARGVKFLYGLGFNVVYNLAYGINWNPELLNIYRDQLDELAEYYIQHPEQERPLNLKKKICSVFSKEKVVRDCGSGKHMKSYDTDGKSYPCHMFAENSLEKETWQKIANANFLDDTLYGDAECDDCPIYRMCPTCYGLNYKERGDIGKRDKSLCGFSKIEILTICKLRYHDLINKSSVDFTKEDYLDLKAVKYLTENLG